MRCQYISCLIVIWKKKSAFTANWFCVSEWKWNIINFLTHAYKLHFLTHKAGWHRVPKEVVMNWKLSHPNSVCICLLTEKPSWLAATAGHAKLSRGTLQLNLLKSRWYFQWLLMICMTYGWGCVCVGKWVDMIGPLSPNPRTTWDSITSCQGLIQAILFHLESWTGWKNILRSKPFQEAKVLSVATINGCSLI